jgi:hypothetical protein
MNTFVKLNIKDIASQLFEEEAVLFKEKINFKLPGGCGFAAHQDTPACKYLYSYLFIIIIIIIANII